MGTGATSPLTPLEGALARDADLRRRILHAASRHTRTQAEAEDLSQNAMEHAIKRARQTGEPTPPVTFFQFVGSIMNSKGATWRRSRRRKPDPAGYDDERVLEQAAVSSADPQGLLTEHAERREQILIEQELRAYMAGEAGEQGRLPLAILEWADQAPEEEEKWGNQELAVKLECEVKDIEAAKKRIGHHGTRIRQRLRGEQGTAS